MKVFDQESLLVKCEQEHCKIAFNFAQSVDIGNAEGVLNENGNPPGVATE